MTLHTCRVLLEAALYDHALSRVERLGDPPCLGAQHEYVDLLAPPAVGID
jgi:hypothetical protein